MARKNKGKRKAKNHDVEVLKLRAAMAANAFRPKVEKDKKSYNRNQNKRDIQEGMDNE